MKKKIIILILSICVNLVLNAQNNFEGEVTYSVKLEIDKKAPISLFTKKISQAKLTDFKLIFKNNISNFFMTNSFREENIYEELAKALIDGGNKYLTKLTSKEVFIQKEISGDYYIIKKKFIEWNLTNERRIINNYEAYKAIAVKKIETRKGEEEREIIAWYSPEIPVSFGLKEYSGLPGLILELKEGNITYKTKKILLNKESNKNLEIVTEFKGAEIKEKELNEMFKNRPY